MRISGIIIAHIMLLLPAVVGAQTVNESVRFDEKIHDFGQIGETDGKVSYRFAFTNVGRDTVTLVRARAGCNCVHAEVSKRPVLPGRKGYVDVTFDPDYRPGHFSKEIVVFSNGRKYNRIWVKGDVTPGFHPVHTLLPYDYGHGLYMNFRRLQFGSPAPGGDKSLTVKIGNDSESTINLTFKVENPHSDFIVRVPPTYLLKSGQTAEIAVTVHSISQISEMATARVIPIVNGFPLSPLEVVLFPPASE